MSGGDTFVQGVDVSKWQTSTPDLSGVHYLIARAGVGTKPDSMYATHIAAARRAGIVTGSYWYNWGSLSVSDQVNAYIAAEGTVDLHAIDWEGTEGFTAAQAQQFISLYRQRTGRRIGLYASESRFRDLGQDWDWIANYSQEPTKHYDLWQYGPFRGVDGDRLPGNLTDLQRLIGDEPMTDIDFIAAPALVDLPQGISILNPDGSARLTNPMMRTGVFSPGTTMSAGGTRLRLINWTGSNLLLAAYGSMVTNVRDLSLTVPVPPAPDVTPFTQADIDAAVTAAVAAQQADCEGAVGSAVEAEQARIRDILGL